LSVQETFPVLLRRLSRYLNQAVNAAAEAGFLSQMHCDIFSHTCQIIRLFVSRTLPGRFCCARTGLCAIDARRDCEVISVRIE
jgi:hypothetical protein